MEQQTDFQHIGISAVSFHQPNELQSQKLVTKRIREFRIEMIILIVLAVLFGVVFALLHPLAGLLVAALFGIAVYGRYRLICKTPKVGVRFGTIVDYYRNNVPLSRCSSSTFRDVTIRLDDSHQIVHGVSLNPLKLYKEPIGRQIMIAKYPNEYRFFPAEDMDPPLPDVNEPLDASHPYETTIDRISPEQVSPDTQKRVRRAIAKQKTRRRLVCSIGPLIFLAAFMLIVVRDICVTLRKDFRICCLLTAAAVIGIFIILHIRDLILYNRMTGIPVQILNYDASAHEIDFQVPGTGQIVRRQHIRYYFCEPDQTESTAILVLHYNHTRSVFPPD